MNMFKGEHDGNNNQMESDKIRNHNIHNKITIITYQQRH